MRGGDIGVFKSTNAGGNWNAINVGLTYGYYLALAIDPQNPSTIYAGGNNYVFKSTNAGGNWSATNNGLSNNVVYALAIDPQNPTMIYAGTNSGGVFQSSNAGGNWNQSNAGLSNMNVKTLAIDPQNPGNIYAGTNGTGVFSIALSLPYGHITAPTNNVTTGPASMQFAANAWESNNSASVTQVEFNVFYDGIWHAVVVDTTSPYETIWQTPTNLRSQQLQFGINVVDTVGNTNQYAGGIVKVNFIESFGGNTSVSENWISSRPYLNQRSLTNGDVKCNVATMGMMLAANGIISPDYASMAAKANEMYPNVLINGIAYVSKMRDELRRQGAISDYWNLSADAAWTTIKQEVDAGRPVIVRTEHGVLTSAGHFFIAVGYRETITNRQVIAYDPFGHWQGTCCENNYDTNTTDSASHKGQWVYYDFDTAFRSSNYLITARPNTGTLSPRKVASPTSPPDVVSDELVTIGTYSGVNASIGLPIYLPIIVR